MSDVKVKIDTTPSQQAVAKASATFQTTDARGRVITLRKPAVLTQFRLVEALGDTAKNETYVAMVMPIIFVSEIDGDTVLLPAKKSEIEALIQRLDEDGLNAVMTAVKEHFGTPDAEADKLAIKK